MQGKAYQIREFVEKEKIAGANILKHPLSLNPFSHYMEKVIYSAVALSLYAVGKVGIGTQWSGAVVTGRDTE